MLREGWTGGGISPSDWETAVITPVSQRGSLSLVGRYTVMPWTWSCRRSSHSQLGTASATRGRIAAEAVTHQSAPTPVSRPPVGMDVGVVCVELGRAGATSRPGNGGCSARPGTRGPSVERSSDVLGTRGWRESGQRGCPPGRASGSRWWGRPSRTCSPTVSSSGRPSLNPGSGSCRTVTRSPLPPHRHGAAVAAIRLVLLGDAGQQEAG